MLWGGLCHAQETSRRHHQKTVAKADSANLYASHLLVDIMPAVRPLLDAANISKKETTPLTLANYPHIADKLIHYYENHGYPFVSVFLKTTYSGSDTAGFQLVVDTNRYITFDSIIVKGGVKLSKHFFYPYLGLRRGAMYQEDIIQAISTKLDELLFATKIQEAGISFVEDKAYLYLYIDSRRTNQFDGYIGLIPVDEKTGKVSVHGALDLNLQNLFKQGEQIDIAWRSSERHSQYLNVSAMLPYFLKTRFGITGSFLLDKQDTSFLTLNYHVGIPYSFAGNSFLQPYFDYTSSHVLSTSLLNLGSGTGYTDYHKTLYGLILHYRHLDYLYNPRKGIEFYADLSVGRRNIILNSQLEKPVNNDAGLKKVNYRLFGGITGYISAGRHFVITPAVQAGTLLSGTHYYNELFKIGGVDYIRGFNTNDLAASAYLTGKAEVRYIFGRQSYIHIFFDGGIYEQNLPDSYFRDFPFGFGMGITFATKAGMFYLDYALGRQHHNPISFKTGKIHFGIRTQF